LLIEVSAALDVSLDILIIGTARPSMQVRELLEQMQEILARLQELNETLPDR